MTIRIAQRNSATILHLTLTAMDTQYTHRLTELMSQYLWMLSSLQQGKGDRQKSERIYVLKKQNLSNGYDIFGK
jgi:hypothetical protein